MFVEFPLLCPILHILWPFGTDMQPQHWRILHHTDQLCRGKSLIEDVYDLGRGLCVFGREERGQMEQGVAEHLLC